MLRVLGLGDNVVDKYLHLGMMFPGGQGMNFPVNAKLLEENHLISFPVEAAFMGVIGTDGAGDHIRNTLQSFSVDISHCRTVEGESGQACITLIDGDRHFSGSNKGGVHRTHPLRLTDDDLLYIKTFDIVHTSNNSYFDPEIPKLASVGIPVSYDFSVTYDDERLQNICPYIRFGFLSCSHLPEAEILHLMKKVHRMGCSNVIATRGGDGPIFYNGCDFFYGNVKPTTPVDTLGAGDAFATGCLVSLLEFCKEQNIRLPQGHVFQQPQIIEAMNLGASLAFYTCQMHGAFGHGAPIA